MVNKPGSVPPQGPKPDPSANIDSPKTFPKGDFAHGQPKNYLGMHFTAEEWNKLMNIMASNLNDYMNKTMQKMTAKLKKDWKRGMGDDDGD
jgi:hypothetical protein